MVKGFRSASEVGMFLTSLVVGLTMVMGPNAINSAPSFMLDYYKYIDKDQNATPVFSSFWVNVLTYYTVVTLVSQALHEPTNLTTFMCRFSLLSRMQVSVLVMLVELIVIVVLPHSGASEASAIAGIVIVAYLGGAARAYFENTGYALFGPCPPKMLTGMLVGSAASSALVSVIQIVLKGVMPDTYASVLTQSIIYFSLALGIIFLGGVLLLSLLCNPFARHYVAEFRSHRSIWHNVYRKTSAARAAQAATAAVAGDGELAAVAAAEPIATADGHHLPVLDDDMLFDDRAPREDRADAAALKQRQLDDGNDDESGGRPSLAKDGAVAAGTVASSDADEQEPLTTAELLQGVRLWPVVREIYPMMISCVLTFGITYLVYPGMLTAVDPEDGWYTTIVMAIYNFGDLVGRCLTLIKVLWVPRKVVVIGSIVRIIFIPLLILCAAKQIPSHAAAYVFTAVLAVSNGFFGTLSMVYAPETPALRTEGERALAGQTNGVMLLAGCAIGSLVQIGLVMPFS
ncbi:solute carrier family 29 (equilibrative nucleoside transporter), member 1/2/3 [Strigomonas culicis]|uniref:Solute carrier family 29 (Equilibrative nucleoside transporter), member 1/2/3 n=1 Tax=Strigomonas culicis TaxID=28005 RepID=S9U789_9TRYP|nr:solute carrier family 29 (equilibrative nucleoside transporter), member 1/2/3 [Strigomonas culicis]|eukprot:EPY26587.1 solute carrier family 29 (equilibrative nucleoside transporter), member 1/2/3 [Strigomonas culicis]